LRKAVIANTIVPVLCGSALKKQRRAVHVGCRRRLSTLAADLPPVKGHDEKTGAEIGIHLVDERVSQALHSDRDRPVRRQFGILPVYSGILKRGSYVYNSVKGQQERVGRIAACTRTIARKSKKYIPGDRRHRWPEADDDGGYALRS